MRNCWGFELSTSANNTFIFHGFSATKRVVPVARKKPSMCSASLFFQASKENPKSNNQRKTTVTRQSFVIQTPLCKPCTSPRANDVATTTEMKEQGEIEVAEGYTMTQFCDKIINFFMNEKPKTKEWRKYLVLREEWKKYRESFYNRCQRRADGESDSNMKEKLHSLWRKVKRE